MTFKDLGLHSSLLDAVELQGYDTPSPIQAKAIPEILQGNDVMAAAQTGTGKTAGFTLPVLQLLKDRAKPQSAGNQARCLVLTPTRELAAQVANSVETYGQNLKLKSAVVFGGVKINPQMMRLRGGVDVLVATPGRLLDLHNQNAIQFDKLEILILDEADRMLDMGFIHDIRRIVKLLPKKRQTLLFSATFSNDIRQLAKSFLYKPVEVSVSPANSTVDTVQQKVIPAEKADKTAILAHLIQENDWFQVLVFSRTKHGANKLVKKLESRGIQSAAIHGNKSQGARTKALAEFKQGKSRVLVATDIAARGIDIDQLPHVVNFDLPQVAEDYVHRIGRTGRAGASGEAISLVSHDEHKMLLEIERLIKKVIPREEIDGFEPKNNLPASKTGFNQKTSQKNTIKKTKPRSASSHTSQQEKQNKEGNSAQGQRSKRQSSENGARQPKSEHKPNGNRRRPSNRSGNRQRRSKKPAN